MSFTRSGVVRGVRASVPVVIGTIPFGLVAGIACQGAGFSGAEAGLMSASVFAGAAQLLALSHWTHPADVLGAAVATLSVNARLLLMGPVLAPVLARARGWRLYAALFVMTDQNWAMAVADMKRGGTDAGFLFGTGAAMWVGWLVTTLLGYLAGAALRVPPGHPLYFAALAIFVSLLVPMWRGRRDALPWLVAAVVATALSRLFPHGSLYVVGGALAGSLATLRPRTHEP